MRPSQIRCLLWLAPVLTALVSCAPAAQVSEPVFGPPRPDPALQQARRLRRQQQQQAAAVAAAARQLLLAKDASWQELAALRGVYGVAGARPRFAGLEGLTPAGKRLLQRLSAASRQGLDPGRQGLPQIQAAVQALAATGEQAAGDQRVAAAARAELALAEGLLRHARAVGAGLVAWARLRLARDAWDSARVTDPALALLAAKGDEAYLQHELQRRLRAALDLAGLERVLSRLEPGHVQYRRLQAALEQYRRLVAGGGWRQIKPVKRLRAGRHSKTARALKQRLELEGHYRGAQDDRHDEALFEAIRRYQQTHQLNPTGQPHRWFWRSLNVPAQRRLKAIEVTLQRWRESAAGRAPYYALVNVPDFHVEIWRQGKRLLRQKIVVGRPRGTKCDEATHREIAAYATPLQSSWIRTLVFSPFWNVTRSIKETELDPERGKDPLFYEKHGYQVMEPGTRGEWVRELPGPANSLGFVKFLFPNPHDTYLHGTPFRNLFRLPIRAFSHGCMRVEHPRQVARLLLQHDGQWREQYYARLHRRWKAMDFRPLRAHWDPEQYRALRDQARRMESGVKLKAPVPVHVEYFTVRVDDAGRVLFLTDIYGLDALRIRPRRPRRCIPESRLAKRNVGKVIEQVEALERQALNLGACVPAAMLLARTLDPKRSWKERLRLKGLQKILGFTEAHGNLARYVRTEHQELMDQLEANAGVWKRSVTERAVRVQRLLAALGALTRDTHRRCQRMFKRLSAK